MYGDVSRFIYKLKKRLQNNFKYLFKFVEEYEPTKADAYRRTIQLQGDEVTNRETFESIKNHR